MESFVSVIHLPVDSPEVQRVAERHHQMSECTVKAIRPEIEFGYEAAVKAATMLATDEAAREFYSFYHENYAEKMGEASLYMGEASLYYAETNLRDL